MLKTVLKCLSYVCLCQRKLKKHMQIENSNGLCKEGCFIDLTVNTIAIICFYLFASIRESLSCILLLDFLYLLLFLNKLLLIECEKLL